MNKQENTRNRVRCFELAVDEQTANAYTVANNFDKFISELWEKDENFFNGNGAFVQKACNKIERAVIELEDATSLLRTFRMNTA